MAAKGGAANDKAGALADSLADLIKGHGLKVEGVNAHPCAGAQPYKEPSRIGG